MKLILLSSCIFLVCQTAQGRLPFDRNFYLDSSFPSTEKVVEEPDILTPGSSEIFNASEYRTENGNAQPILKERNSVLENQNSSESTTDGQTSTNSSISIPDGTTSTPKSTTVFGNESQSQNLSQLISNVPHETASQDTNSNSTSNITVWSPNDESNEDEQEGVVRGKPNTTESSSTTTSQPQSLYQKTWAYISDTYTLSILVPVAAGVVFATTIILTIAFCRCLRRCCIRRRLRKKVLPDSVKNLRPSDRARLLAESSDDEF